MKHSQIFVNLPVKDLKRSVAFFTKLGYTFNAQFTDDTATCMIISDDIYVMLLTHAKFKEFTPKPIARLNGEVSAFVVNELSNKEVVVVDRAR